jgi:hypothetical protein
VGPTASTAGERDFPALRNGRWPAPGVGPVDADAQGGDAGVVAKCTPSIVGVTGDRAVTELIRLTHEAGAPGNVTAIVADVPMASGEVPKAPHPGVCLQLPNLSMSPSVKPGPVGVKDPRAHSEVVPGIRVRSPADATNSAWLGTAVRVSRPPAKWTKL